MDNKDGYNFVFVCHSCKQEGAIYFYEDSSVTPPERKAKCISGNFNVRMKNRVDAEVICSNCGKTSFV